MTERIVKAATYLEGLVEEQKSVASEEQLSRVREIIEALRTTERKDLDKAVWASVLTCLGCYKTAFDANIALALTEAKL
jgi:flagellin-specific chaperone FliS